MSPELSDKTYHSNLYRFLSLPFFPLPPPRATFFSSSSCVSLKKLISDPIKSYENEKTLFACKALPLLACLLALTGYIHKLELTMRTHAHTVSQIEKLEYARTNMLYVYVK